MSESHHFNFWDWEYYWLFEGLSPFKINNNNNNNNKMDSLIPTRLLMLERVTEGSFWKETKQVPFPMISVLRTARSSTHSQNRSWWGAENPWETAHRGRKVQHVGFLRVDRPLTPRRLNFKVWVCGCQYKLYLGLYTRTRRILLITQYSLCWNIRLQDPLFQNFVTSELVFINKTLGRSIYVDITYNESHL